MEASEFVDILREVVATCAADGVVAQLAKPSGRSPLAAIKAQSAWFNSLSEKDRAHVETAVHDAARATLFGMLCVLDGARQIENPEQRGHLELRYSRDGQTVLLASSDYNSSPSNLHELL